MQRIKEELRRRILAAAKREFLEKGFEGASLRAIAAAAGTAKSNLHNYFEDKDALFLALASPVAGLIRRALEIAAAKNADARPGSYGSEGQASAISAVAAFVAANTDEVRLLLFAAGGSSLAGFKEEVIERFADILFEWFGASAQGVAPSRLFVTCVAGFYLSGLERILLESASAEDARGYIGEFQAFVYGGWSRVIGKKDKENRGG
jgi:AcrR family transcriptional regulator